MDSQHRLMRAAGFGLALALSIRLLHALPRPGAIAVVLAVLGGAVIFNQRRG